MDDGSSEHVATLLKRIEATGVTGPAAQWLIKALHPPSNCTSVGIPDESFRPSVRQDFRPSAIISAPAGLPSGATWDLCLVTMPGDVSGAFWCAAPAGTDFSTDGPIPGEQLGWLPLQSTGAYAAIYRHYFDGSIIEPGGLTSTPDSYPNAFRTTYRALTAHLTATALYNGGTVTSGQFDRDYSETNRFTTDLTDTWHAAHTRVTLPLTEAVMTQIEPNTVVWPARDGVYIPHRLLGPAQKFVSRRPIDGLIGRPYMASGVDWKMCRLGGSVNDPGQTHTLATSPHVYATRPSTLTDASYVGWITRLVTGQANPPLAVPYNGETGFDSVASSVTIFRGLSDQANVTVRAYVGIEMVPFDYSPLIAFVRAAAEPSPAAMREYFLVASSMAGVYPARFNAFGMLLPFLAKKIAAIAPIVAPHLIAAARALFSSAPRPSPSPPPPPPPAPAVAAVRSAPTRQSAQPSSKAAKRRTRRSVQQ